MARFQFGGSRIGAPRDRPNIFCSPGHWLATLLLPLWLFVSSPWVFADTDRLALPARSTLLADRSLLLDVASLPGRIIAVGERGHIVFSDDEGIHWRQAQVPVSASLTAVHFVDSHNGWAVGHDGVVLHSNDGGLSWDKPLDGVEINRVIVKHYELLLERLQARLDEGAVEPDSVAEAEELLENYSFALDDARVAKSEGPTKPLLDLLFVSATHGWVVGSYGLILETQDGGQTWLPRMERLSNPDGYHLNAITITDDGTLFIAGEAGVLFRSLDSGRSWQPLDSPYDGSFYAIAEIKGSNDLLVTGLRGRGYLSVDGGDSWDELDTATRSTLTSVVQMSNGAVIVAGSNGTLAFSEDGGHRFRSLIQPGRRHYSAAAMTGSGGLILVGQGGVSLLTPEQVQEMLR